MEELIQELNEKLALFNKWYSFFTVRESANVAQWKAEPGPVTIPAILNVPTRIELVRLEYTSGSMTTPSHLRVMFHASRARSFQKSTYLLSITTKGRSEPVCYSISPNPESYGFDETLELPLGFHLSVVTDAIITFIE